MRMTKFEARPPVQVDRGELEAEAPQAPLEVECSTEQKQEQRLATSDLASHQVSGICTRLGDTDWNQYSLDLSPNKIADRKELHCCSLIICARPSPPLSPRPAVDAMHCIRRLRKWIIGVSPSRQPCECQ